MAGYKAQAFPCPVLPGTPFSAQIVTTLGIIGSLATAMGSACSKFCRAFIPGVFGALADSKVQAGGMRDTQGGEEEWRETQDFFGWG